MLCKIITKVAAERPPRARSCVRVFPHVIQFLPAALFAAVSQITVWGSRQISLYAVESLLQHPDGFQAHALMPHCELLGRKSVKCCTHL